MRGGGPAGVLVMYGGGEGGGGVSGVLFFFPSCLFVLLTLFQARNEEHASPLCLFLFFSICLLQQ